MATSISKITSAHPCFALGKPNKKGRIHLPVSPGCNICCKFCDRKINTTELRPGVTGEIITPEEALDVVRKAVELCPEITVVGIAGPGETLATPHALKTFRLLRNEFPELIKCMSTNGLLLAEMAEDVVKAGVNTLTVTVNAVDPAILAQIVDFGHPELLIRNQMEGIRLMCDAGIIVKVNTVLVPGVNDGHIEEIAKAAKAAGASLYNIIPLIPRHELAERKAPSCVELDRARQSAEKHIDVFRHCRHCRADEIGVPGQNDYAEQIYLKRLNIRNTFSHG